MKPIINPLWVYFIDVLSNLEPILITLLTIPGGVLLIYVIWYFMTSGGKYSDEEHMIQPFKKSAKVCVIVSVISIIAIVIIPTKETIYTMMALEQITPDNISAVGKTGENIIDYIADKIDQVVSEEEKE